MKLYELLTELIELKRMKVDVDFCQLAIERASYLLNVNWNDEIIIYKKSFSLYELRLIKDIDKDIIITTQQLEDLDSDTWIIRINDKAVYSIGA